MRNLEVEVAEKFICITDENGDEVVYWHQDEWVEDPELVVPAIANAIHLAYTDPEKLLGVRTLRP
jgi:PHD/YefM family antitoxin component YafN of YafNO toxin-antitoxin module